MSAFDTAKEIVRIGSTAGLSKDVIDLLEKKATLLAEKIADLEKENGQLKTENVQLRIQLQRTQPIGFKESMGVLWKQTATGFEAHPYCKECESHPVMTPKHRAGIWSCGTGEHHAPLSVKPPTTHGSC